MIMQMAEAMPLSELSKMAKEDPHTIMNIIKYYVAEAKRKADYSDVVNLGVDETAKAR